MTSSGDVRVRDAVPGDVTDICLFGEEHIPAHYAPLIGAEAAAEQVRRWWAVAQIGAAVSDGRVVVAEQHGRLVGVAQRGLSGADHVVYKLYVHPGLRGCGVGPRLVDALVAQLPTGTDRLFLEHFAANGRAAAFYEREGFVVDHVETSPTGDPRLDVVWRVRDVATQPRGL